jgi:hypothetical protein
MRRRLLLCSLLVLAASCGLPKPNIPSLGSGPGTSSPRAYSIPVLGTSRAGSTRSVGPAM